MLEFSVMNETISLLQAIEIIDRTENLNQSVPFDISFRSLQRNSKTGGKLYTYKQVKKLRKKPQKLTQSSFLAAIQSTNTAPKHPNHFKNRTRNIELQNGDIKKIHIRLIISINGKNVIY